MIWFGWFLWHINHCRSLIAKFSLYIYIYVCVCVCVCVIWLVGFYGISAIMGYFIPNLLYTYMSYIYALVWLGFMAYQPLWVI